MLDLNRRKTAATCSTSFEGNSNGLMLREIPWRGRTRGRVLRRLRSRWGAKVLKFCRGTRLILSVPQGSLECQRDSQRRSTVNPATIFE
jgi:hypothetical protein